MNKRLTAIVILVLMTLMLFVLQASTLAEPVQLVGRTIFVGYFSTSGFEFSPADYNYCEASAVLTQTGRTTYELALSECGFRDSTWELAITPGGAVSGIGWPEDEGPEAEVALHTGCNVTHGTFPVFRGTWDGTRLQAYTHFNGRCDGGTFWGDPLFWDGWDGIPGVEDPDGILDDGVTWDDGPAHVTFGLELAAAD